MNRTIRPAPLALALGLALAGAAIAQTAPTPAQQKELDAARAELDRAAQRYGELAGKYGGDAPIRIEKRVLRKPVIGVLLAPDEAAGVRIAGVTPGSAAADGGLKSGDRILTIDGKAIRAGDAAARVDEARGLLSALDAKKTVQLAYERDGGKRTVVLTPKVGDRLMVMPDGAMFDGEFDVFARDGEIRLLADRARREAGDAAGNARIARVEARTAAGDAKRHAEWAAAIAPEVRTEIIRLGNDCKGQDCKLPLMAEAFRWNGLNLASVDPQLGRYFGSDSGVLVLSAGKELDGLQAGDVILKIAGKPVANPREAMDALRAQPAGSRVAVDYLRDRRNASAQVAVPRAMPLSLPRIAAAPRAPGMPGAVERRTMVLVGPDGKVQTFDDGDGPARIAMKPRDGKAVQKRHYVMVDKDGKRTEWEGGAGDTPPTWVDKIGKDAKQVQKRRYVMVDKDGKRTEWEGDAGETPPAWVQAMPKDGKRVEKRVKVIVDETGKEPVIAEDGLPPPPPPPAPPKGG
jgi:membrane-associated protease RseP (regulator of RpoE activity)